ncbi:MAG: DciA family protein [Rhizobiaceae bacterium]
MKKPASFKPIGGAVTALLDPLLAKRSHVDAALALSWPELCGQRLAGRTQPLKVTWPRRSGPDDAFEPGVLTIACEGAAALDLQYGTSELISRINGYFGYAAIGRIRIEQKRLDQFRSPPKPTVRQVSDAVRAAIAREVGSIEDEGLKEALQRLGASVSAETAGRTAG